MSPHLALAGPQPGGRDDRGRRRGSRGTWRRPDAPSSRDDAMGLPRGPGCCRRPMMSFTAPGPTAGSRIRPPSVVDVVGLGYPPGVVTSRTRLLAKLAMYRLPAASTNRPYGMFRHVWVAGPPSPQKPLVPLPATVVMVPSGATRRTRLLSSSLMYRLPAASTARPAG